MSKVVDGATDVNAMQTTLNEYGAAGWERIILKHGRSDFSRIAFKA